VEVQSTRTVMVPWILSYLPINHFFVMVACPGHILSRTIGFEIKLSICIDGNERKCSAMLFFVMS